MSQNSEGGILSAEINQYIHLMTTELNAGRVANGLMTGSVFCPVFFFFFASSCSVGLFHLLRALFIHAKDMHIKDSQVSFRHQQAIR